MGSEISRLKRDFDFIIIDSPPHTEAEAKTAIRAADLVLIPVQPSPTDLWATAATVKLCLDERIPAKVVLNRVQPNSKLAQMALDHLGKQNVIATTLGNRVLFASALMEGRTATEVSPSHAGSTEIKDLAKAVMKLLPGAEPAKSAKKAKAKESEPA